MATVLVVDDDPGLRALLAEYLSGRGLEVQLAADGREALARLRAGAVDLCVLDLMMPGMDGFELLGIVRREPALAGLPVLMLTARGEDTDRIVGLELGADDYLSKPFSMAELLARVKALLRRAEMREAALSASASERPLVQGALQIWPAKRTVAVRGAPVELTALEFELLLYFAQHPGRVFSRSQLLDAVWGYSHDGYEHTVTTHINRLRAKLETDPMRPEWVLTVRGAGYKFRE